MAALIGADLDQAQAIAREAAQGEVCAPANDNAPGQVVVSGHKSAVERAVALAAERGIKRSIMLPVSAPFHCALMKPAADEMAEALAEAKILPPSVPVVANVTAAPVKDPETIRRLLVEQVTGLVRWRESVLAMRRWLSGPSTRIGWPSPCFDFSQRMTKGPRMKLMTSAVITAPPLRKVR
jgi:[acyl-carrier-protein] S-malonyltransferase